jgi:hypothetical protein
VTLSEFDKLDDKLVLGARWIVEELDKRNTNVYVTLAKLAMWIVAAVLTVVLTTSLIVWDLSLAVQTSQVIVMLAVSVLGFHEYKGSRILHVIRNWKNT